MPKRRSRLIRSSLAACLISGGLGGVFALPALAVIDEAARDTSVRAPAGAPSLSATPRRTGRVTNRAIPRFVSLKSNKINVRHGPSQDHVIDWVFVRRGLPIEVLGENGHWRLIRDVDGEIGWIHMALLNERFRTTMVVDERIAMRRAPDDAAEPVAYLEYGVVSELRACQPVWCRVRVDGYEGWVPKSTIWGVYWDEAFD